MSSISNNQKQDQHSVLRVLRTRDEARAFYNKIARVYDFLSESTEEPMRKFGLDQLDVRDGERVLEIGFGTGTSLVALARMVGSHGKVSSVVVSASSLCNLSVLCVSVVSISQNR